MISVEKCNDFILEKFNLKVEDQSDSWIEYTDGLKILFVDKTCFHYYFKSSETAAPITPDIVILVDLIRDIVLNIEPEYDVFKLYHERYKSHKEVFNDEEH